LSRWKKDGKEKKRKKTGIGVDRVVGTGSVEPLKKRQKNQNKKKPVSASTE